MDFSQINLNPYLMLISRF